MNDHRFLSSDASALRTSASDNPNCRAISVGFTPALNAARTAFNFPVAKGTPANFNRCFRTGVLSATTGLVQRRSNQSVEFLIVEMLDRAGKVSRQNMSRLFSHAV